MDTSREWKIRDTRKPGHFWAYNEILDEYGPIIGAYAFAVYMALCRVARYGECRFSLRQMAQKLAVSPQTIMRSLQKLQDVSLIREIDTSTSVHKPSIFQLVDTHEDDVTVPIGNGESSHCSSEASLTVPVGNTIKTKSNNTGNTKEEDFSLNSDTSKKEKVFILPDWIKTSAWEDFLEMRKSKKKPTTNRAKQMIVDRLKEFMLKGHDPNKILMKSVLHAWDTVYEPKQEQWTEQKIQTQEPEEDAVKRERRKEAARA